VAGAAVALVGGSAGPMVLLAIWNHARRRRYLRVSYDRARLVRFAAAALPIALLSVWPRTLRPAREAAIALTTSTAILITVWLLLTPSERQTGRAAIARRLAPLGTRSQS
jgi:hypothetical protein